MGKPPTTADYTQDVSNRVLPHSGQRNKSFSLVISSAMAFSSEVKRVKFSLAPLALCGSN